ncbi:zinc ABC transporter substrate-binding protein [Tabrizicola sp. J26]|uniref:zinc ABC transporter substrate-binding protein n=1 Tax=Alitabrizicola rongguiensis TaxID=2909234 RepID=UPI001F3B28F7|nr:zinc ABC transporter substrate-binding protein [Tabrizicola rongguiensis]MCF1707856.1 zinc ABC transporter substrate-binding protein [Tabrizicola rongguiensis]
MRYIISAALASILALPAAAEVPRVVTDIPPVQSLVQMVMGNLGEPAMLLDKGGNAHDFQLKPSQVAALADAQLVVWIGPEMTPWLDRALESTSTEATRLALLHLPGVHTRSYAEGHEDHDHEEAAAGTEQDHAAEEEHDHDEEEAGHHHGGLDPHAWLDPTNAELWLGQIAEQLAILDPENAANYKGNATAAAQKIAEIDASLRLQLSTIAGKPFVVFHDAYGYFAEHYGLNIAGSVSAGDAASPGVAHLRELQAELGKVSGLCIFPEVRHDPKLVEAMATDTGARLGAPLDPEGAGGDVTAATYPDILTGMAATLIACLATP